MSTQTVVTSQPTIPPDLIEQAAQEVADPNRVIEGALQKLATDPGALLEESVLNALRTLRQDKPAEFSRYRVRAKKLNKDFRIADLDRLIGQEGGPDESATTRLIALARTKCQLCHDADGKGVAIIERDTHREVWMVQGPGFSEWLRGEYFNQYELGVPDIALSSAILTIGSICVYRGDLVEVHTRCAKSGEAYYIDLCDEKWCAIRIDQTGWTILDRPPVLFTRNEMMRPLPAPQLNGDLEFLWKYVNVPEHQRQLVITWLMDSMRPDTPFPVLEIIGEQGSAKSTSQRHLRDLIDPNKVALRGAPKTIEDIYVGAKNNYVVSYENLSRLANDEQDALCTLSTGGGFATRQFYTNGGEHVIEAKRPVMLNGISGVATRPDLIERTIRIDAPSIPSNERREDTDIAANWEADRPKILGALLTRFSASLRLLPKVQLEKKQRMADFEKLGEASMKANGFPAGTFSSLYAKAVAEGTERALDSFTIANALIALMTTESAKKDGWSGTVGELYTTLQTFGVQDRMSWPRSPRGLSDQLSRLAPALRTQGLEVTFGARTNGGRRISIKFQRPNTSITGTDMPSLNAP